MEWILRYVIQSTLAPWISFLVSLVVLPIGSLVIFLMYRMACKGKPSREPNERHKEGKIRWVLTKNTTFNDILFAIGIGILLGLWVYAQQTLYWQILKEEESNQSDATSADKACNIVDNHPGRNTVFMDPGCKAAKTVLLTVVPSDQAYRRWFELLTSFDMGIWPWSEESTAVAVPFGLGRLMVFIAIILFTREWLAPMVTSLKGFGNRMFRTAAVA